MKVWLYLSMNQKDTPYISYPATCGSSKPYILSQRVAYLEVNCILVPRLSAENTYTWQTTYFLDDADSIPRLQAESTRSVTSIST